MSLLLLRDKGGRVSILKVSTIYFVAVHMVGLNFYVLTFDHVVQAHSINAACGRKNLCMHPSKSHDEQSKYILI